jgi:thiamine biosynthesis protein ThiS
MMPSVPPADASSATMTISLNGDPRDVPAACTLAGLLAHLDLDPRAVVVEHNRAIIRRDTLGTVTVQPGDVVEIVHFVGGG